MNDGVESMGDGARPGGRAGRGRDEGGEEEAITYQRALGRPSRWLERTLAARPPAGAVPRPHRHLNAAWRGCHRGVQITRRTHPARGPSTRHSDRREALFAQPAESGARACSRSTARFPAPGTQQHGASERSGEHTAGKRSSWSRAGSQTIPGQPDISFGRPGRTERLRRKARIE